MKQRSVHKQANKPAKSSKAKQAKRNIIKRLEESQFDQLSVKRTIDSSYALIADDLDNNPDTINLRLLRKMHSDVIGCLATAKKHYLNKPGQSPAYAFAALVNLAREIGNDIKNAESLEDQVNYTIHDIFPAAFRSVLQVLFQEVSLIKNAVDSKLDRSERVAIDLVFNESLRSIATNLEKIKENLIDQMSNIFLDTKKAKKNENRTKY